jgi:hypothetical protein
MTFPMDKKMLMDLNVWIADTAATVHTMPHAYGGLVDECTQLKFTDFFKTKDGMIKPPCKQFQ